MEDKIYWTELFFIYKNLLTDKQKEIFEMHFSLDLSLSEIAEEKGITRQNVSDTVKNVKDKLKEFESALKIKEKSAEIISLAEGLTDKTSAEKIKEIVGR